MNKRKQHSNTKSKKTNHSQPRTFVTLLWLIPVGVFIVGVCLIQYDEIIAIDNGTGWDGGYYRDLAIYGSEHFINKQLNPYRIQRVVPSLLVHYSLKAAFLLKFFQPNDLLKIHQLVIQGFQWYNFTLIILSSCLWVLVMQRLCLKPVTAWLGFIALFVNFATIKYSFYYPPLTDTTAFFLGMAMVYTSIVRRLWLLLLLSAIGFFTWPTLFIVGVFLYIFSQPVNTKNPRSIPQFIWQIKKLPAILSLVLICLMAFLMWYLLIYNNVHFIGVEEPSPALVYISLPILFITITVITYNISDIILRYFPLTNAITLLNMALAGRIVLVGCLYFGLWALKQYWQNPELPVEMNAKLFIGGSLRLAIAKPFLGFIAQWVYYGPVVIICGWLMKELLYHALELSLGFFIIVACTLIASVVLTESRQIINLYPFIALSFAVTVNKYTIPAKVAWIFALLALLVSKLWLPINFTGMNELVHSGSGLYYEFPLQKYFMNSGPWMSWESYWYQSAGMVFCTLLLWLIARQYLDVPRPLSRHSHTI